MKIAITSKGEEINSETSSFFGRCPFFILFDIKDNEILSQKSIANEATEQTGGAGIMAAQIVGNSGAEAVITGNTGPRAFGVLQELEIEIYKNIGGTVEENINAFMEGRLEKISNPGPMGVRK